VNSDKMQEMNARADAVNYIALGLKSSGKVSGWLLKKGYPDFIVEAVVAELIEERTIDDEALAERMIRGRSGKRLEAPRALMTRLVIAGIPRSVAEEVVDRSFDQERDEEREAGELLSLKFSANMSTMQEWEPPLRLKFRSKLYRFLLSKGYESDLSLRVVERWIRQQGMDESIE
jgi:regulatory protein